MGIATSLEDQVRILSNIKDGLNYGDLLYTINAFDKMQVRTEFPITRVDSRENNEMLIIYSLGLDNNHFKQEFIYNEKTKCRELNLILKCPITINFKKLGTKIEFDGLEKINVYNHRRDSYELISEKLKSVGMELKFLYLNDTNAKIPLIGYLSTVA